MLLACFCSGLGQRWAGYRTRCHKATLKQARMGGDRMKKALEVPSGGLGPVKWKWVGGPSHHAKEYTSVIFCLESWGRSLRHVDSQQLPCRHLPMSSMRRGMMRNRKM